MRNMDSQDLGRTGVWISHHDKWEKNKTKSWKTHKGLFSKQEHRNILSLKQREEGGGVSASLACSLQWTHTIRNKKHGIVSRSSAL